MHAVERVENLICLRPAIGSALQFVGKNVQQHFRVRSCTQVSAILALQMPGQFVVVGQIAIVRKTNAVR